MAALADTFWRGKRVFITGHSGFKGVWLSLWLQSLGADGIRLLDFLDGFIDRKASSRFPCNRFEGIFAMPTNCILSLIATRPDVVIHMAAQPFVRKALQDPWNLPGQCHRDGDAWKACASAIRYAPSS